MSNGLTFTCDYLSAALTLNTHQYSKRLRGFRLRLDSSARAWKPMALMQELVTCCAAIHELAPRVVNLARPCTHYIDYNYDYDDDFGEGWTVLESRNKQTRDLLLQGKHSDSRNPRPGDD